jgi:hypothetical protein
VPYRKDTSNGYVFGRCERVAFGEWKYLELRRRQGPDRHVIRAPQRHGRGVTDKGKRKRKFVPARLSQGHTINLACSLQEPKNASGIRMLEDACKRAAEAAIQQLLLVCSSAPGDRTGPLPTSFSFTAIASIYVLVQHQHKSDLQRAPC